jgi:hypothetical protein
LKAYVSLATPFGLEVALEHASAHLGGSITPGINPQ